MQRAMLWIGPLLAGFMFFWLKQVGLPAEAVWTATITTLCAVWWLTEAIPLPATSLLPLALLPLLGVLTPSQIAEAYGHHLILLLLGGFMLSTAMERCGVHRRIALSMVRAFGGDRAGGGRRLVFGFAVASAALSMWISNTATCLMLLPIAMAVVGQGVSQTMRIALMLGIAYGASIGGIATPVGTPPNLVFMQAYEEHFGEAPTFLEWMRTALPITIVMIPLMTLWLTRKITADQPPIKLPPVGKWQTDEIRTLVVFALTALLWVTRKEPFGGWSGYFELPTANDASVALLAVVVMFLIPNGKSDGKEQTDGRVEKLLDWETASNIPWGILILFGAGIAIAKAFTVSTLADTLGEGFAHLTTLPILLMLAVLCLLVTFLTEMTSNTATTALLMPILASAAIATETDPRLLMIPAAISASFAFMLPVATAPNSVVFGSGQVSIRQMATEGFVLNLLGAAVITLLCYFLLG